MTFINTRPSDRAKPLTEHLHRAGVDVLDLPLLTMQPLSLRDVERERLHHWQDYDVVVVVSPTAAELFLQQVTNLTKSINTKTSSATKSVPVQVPVLVVVGQTTAQVLERHGLAMQIPKTSNNEGMLALSSITKLKAGQQVLICRGVGGRRLLIDALSHRGVQVDTVSLYQRQLPKQTQSTFADWVIQTCGTLNDHTVHTDRLLATVLISSGESFEHWQQICQHLFDWSQTQRNKPLGIKPIETLNEFAKPSRYHYLVLGERLYALLTEQQLDVTQLDNLEPQHILAQYQGLASYYRSPT